VDLEVAVAAGLAVVLPLYKIFILPEICDSPKLSLGEAVVLLVTLASYLSLPLLFGLFRGQRGARFVWLWTPIMGSMLTTVALYCLVALKEWSPAQFAMVWLALCVWTLLFAAVVYYSGMIIRGIGDSMRGRSRI
jgi:hypothetical protein